MNETIETKRQKLIQDITSIINTKYKEQYMPEVEKKIDVEIAEILRYFKNDSNLKRSNIMFSIISVENYLEIAKLDIKNSMQKLLLTRQEKSIQEANSGISISKNGLAEELIFNDKKLRLQSCFIAIESMIKEKISEVEAKIINDLYREGYSGVFVNNFSLNMDNEKEKLTKHFIINIEKSINSLDMELITEIAGKCKNEDKEKMKNTENESKKREIAKPENDSETERLKAIISQINPQDRIDMIKNKQKESEDLER